ncbi:bacterial alpha-L-rhamnosidase-domain-containing protein [Mycena galopus ATCC 62051]|nr:bacterial alpha-L-rhamnosidase-domain-containing protein [Mycena galopus ATCC 62051]
MTDSGSSSTTMARFSVLAYSLAAWAVSLAYAHGSLVQNLDLYGAHVSSDLRDNPPISLSSLLVENKVAPIGIDVNPRFSWLIASSERSVSQQGYRLTVSAVTPGAADVWDSGNISSALPYLAEYAGPALRSDTVYFWKVVVATTLGATSASSNFTTGFLSQDDWSPSLWIGKNTSVVPVALSAAFTAASWIWTSELDQPNAPPGDYAFRRTYVSPPGKNAVSATVVITVDDLLTLYVNGADIASSPNVTDSWQTAQIIHIPTLNASSNLFAVLGTNLPNGNAENPAGLLAAVQITFDDGTQDIFASDSTWRATGSPIPDDFQSPALDDSSWSPVSSLGTYGVDPWDTQVVLAAPTTTIPSLSTASWIWAAEPDPPNAPVGEVAFRRTFATPAGKTAVSAIVVVTADDLYTLYLNGEMVGSAPNETNAWEIATLYRVPLNETSNLFAVLAMNVGTVDNAAGLLTTITIQYADGSEDFIVSDSAWKVTAAIPIPADFAQPGTDDSAWASAAELGVYGVAPWGTGVTVSDPLGEHPAPLLRKSFTLDSNNIVAFARLYYSAGGFASITLNGLPASHYVLSPGFTKYDTQVQYVGLDVTALLTAGENVLALELGRNYYGITQVALSEWNWVDAAWHGEPAFRCVLSIGYADGTTQRIVSDTSWKTIEGPTRLDDIYGGENYNASYIIPGYELPGFDDSGWDNAEIMSGPAGALVNARQPPTRLLESLRPISITQPVPGIYIATFERVVAGWARITASGPKGTLITVHFGEKLNPDGTVIYLDVAHNFANNWQTDRFWLAGTGGAETFEPKFSYKGFLYVQLEGWPGPSPPTADDIIGQVVHDDFETYGDFNSSSELFNQMHAAVRYTMLNNVHSIPTDCPTFEKKGWSGDAMLATEMFLSNFGSSELLAKYVRDLHETRVDGAGPPDVIGPDTGFGWDTQAPTWHSALILTPAWIYEYRGDKRVLTDHYDSMKSYIEFELGRSPEGISTTWLGDWNTPETDPNGANPPEDLRVPATAFLYQMFVTMQEIAMILSQPDDAASFAQSAVQVKSAFNDAFFNASLGHYAGVGDSGYRQSHNILALAFNLTQDGGTAVTVAKSIVTDVTSRDIHLNTGALSTKHLLPVLTAYGYVDVALALAQQTTFPSWGFWIENGATTTWEHWLVAARSHDHFFLGTFEDWFFKSVLGIQSTSIAFQTVDIVPVATGALEFASGWMLTPFGNLTVAWTRTAASLTLDLGVPVGVTATVNFDTASEVTESGVNVMGLQGISVLPSAYGQPLRLAVGSGRYIFVAS